MLNLVCDSCVNLDARQQLIVRPARARRWHVVELFSPFERESVCGREINPLDLAEPPVVLTTITEGSK